LANHVQWLLAKYVDYVIRKVMAHAPLNRSNFITNILTVIDLLPRGTITNSCGLANLVRAVADDKEKYKHHFDLFKERNENLYFAFAAKGVQKNRQRQ